MVLRKLSMYGFKSFADKTELRFGEGLTAVIGPNGCGKSNVVDAIRWVFGEQKASMLRSASMQDVIFSGTQNRQPLNLAEVTITIENTRGILPLEYNEVAITRRVYRNGEGEYRINKAPCRLKDIQNMFLDTGVGSNAYTTIENGMINKILSDKAEERRILFEEAAGIGKYKQRIKESQRKLDRTRQDLLRINDRTQEKDRYVKMLARQVEKAKRYKRYRDDLMNLEVGFENRRYRTIEERMAGQQETLSKLESNETEIRSRLGTDESGIEQKEIQKVEKENELSIASQNVSNAGEKIHALDREISVGKQSLDIFRQNVTRFGQEIETYDSQVDEKRTMITNIENSLVERESLLQEHVIRVDGAKGELEQFDARLDTHKEELDELTQRQLASVHEVGEHQRSRSTCLANLTNAIERSERDEKEIRRLEARIEEYRESMELCRQQLETENTAYGKLMQGRDSLLARIDTEDTKYHEFMEREKRLEAQIDACKAQLRFLEGLDASFEGYETGVKALLTENLPGSKGIIAGLIDLEDQSMVPLVEKALGTDIQTVVFETDDQMRSAVGFLTESKVGTAKVISVERCDRAAGDSKIPVPTGMKRLRDFVRTKPECEHLVDHLLGHIFVVDTLEEVLAAEGTAGRGTIVIARDGTMALSNGAVVVGSSKKEDIGILQRKQQIETLGEDIQRHQKEYEKTIHVKETCIINRDEAKRALVEVDDKLNTGRQRKQEQETNITHYENEIRNTKDRINVLQPGLVELREQIAGFEAQLEEHDRVISELGSAREDLEQEIAQGKARLGSLEEEREGLAEHLKNVELAMHGLKNRVEQDKQSIERLTKDIQSLGNGKQQKIEDKNRTSTEIRNLEEKVIALDEELKTQNEKRTELERVLAEVREQYNGILHEIDQVRKTVRTEQQELEGISNRKHSLEMEQTRDGEQLRSIRERIYQSYEIDLASPPEDLPMLDKEDADVTENIQMLKERLRRVGEVNMGALHEFETENAELEELVRQRDDLQTAVDDLERAIRKLNREARSQFVETFEKVRANFTDMFTSLFEGGEAQLALQEDVDPLTAAIEINVRPAGKKMRGVTLLSGGERALTAISLLFALYQVKPSAYCILDELDAPLDDANVDRFIKVLNRFADKTQFIMVTHNKRSMEAADILYGVTQQEKGVSTIASVNLSEIQLEAA